jgi:uncharacterized protein YbdZ (MbtH family)
MDIRTLADAVNARASGYSIGNLQSLRAELKQLKRIPGSAIFSSQTVFDEWAFHHGGRSELQFNVGLENSAVGEVIRYGLAFSFETSRSLPSIEVLVPKVALFNEYVRENRDLLSGFEMWHHQDGSSYAKRVATPITPDLVREGTFVFVGSYALSNAIEADDVLEVFDQLLPLYRYVESGGVASQSNDAFDFHPGNSKKKREATGSATERALSITLRHNELQEDLYNQLCDELGADNVGTEISSGTGGRIDIVSRDTGNFTFYEIKVGRSIRAIIREAIGQLLEYSLWPGASRPAGLVIVGEPPLDEAARTYLRALNDASPIPLSYRQVSIA